MIKITLANYHYKLGKKKKKKKKKKKTHTLR